MAKKLKQCPTCQVDITKTNQARKCEECGKDCCEVCSEQDSEYGVMCDECLQKSAEVSYIEESNETRLLRVKLTDGELLEKGQELAEAYKDLRTHNDELDSIKKEYKGKISAAETQIESLSGILRERYESRKVDCVIVKDFQEGTIVVTRLDTDTVIENRKMTNEQRELGLKNIESKANPDEDPDAPAEDGSTLKLAENEVSEEDVDRAWKIILDAKRASSGLLTRRGFTPAEAIRVLDILTERGKLGPAKESGETRDILEAGPAETPAQEGEGSQQNTP